MLLRLCAKNNKIFAWNTRVVTGSRFTVKFVREQEFILGNC